MRPALHAASARPVQRHRRRHERTSASASRAGNATLTRSSTPFATSLQPVATVLVLEDLHWADEATLDVLRMLGRRIDAIPGLVLATYRDDELDRSHPLRMVLGELSSQPGIERIRIEPLSTDAVEALARGYDIDAAELYRRTSGNPFYVHEILEAGGTCARDGPRRRARTSCTANPEGLRDRRHGCTRASARRRLDARATLRRICRPPGRGARPACWRHEPTP